MRGSTRASSTTAAQCPSEATQAVECWGSSGRGSPAQHSRALRNLNAEVAHTNAEVRQTLGVIEQAGVRRVVADQCRQVRGQDGRTEDQGEQLLKRRGGGGGRRGGRRRRKALQRARRRRGQLLQDRLGAAGGGRGGRLADSSGLCRLATR